MEWRAGRFVRPLLGVRKEELSAYLGALGEGWREDATNAEPTYKRNRIRLQLLPLLEELTGGGLLARLGAASEQSAQLREWLDQAHAAHVAADPAWARSGGRALSVAPLLAAQTMVQEELLHRLARGASVGRLSLTRDALRRVRAQLARSGQEWVLELSGGWLLRRTGATVSIAGAEASVAELAVGEAGVRLRHPAELAVRAGVARGPRAELPPGALALRLGGLGSERELTLREWRRGDRFHPQGRRAPVSLSHFLRGLDVPLDERRRAPLLCLPNSSTVVAVCRPAHVGSGFEVAAPSPGAEAAAEEPCLWVQILDQ
uniref:Lysidine-tRNA(Ile) synthetase C-terminal domain-containing protein n=2 Tax=Emiliania huxleyi TaxID=2903 RepID=A0A6V2SWH5_EMIHU|mmetsp:Transcript_13871/g.41018  ORF Transcript_13871/g.41018 Transcript_13871/m.41018 type:complete len:318 (-) Transcript_13871:97-1050(-)